MTKSHPILKSCCVLLLGAFISVGCAYSTVIWKPVGPQLEYDQQVLTLFRWVGFGGAFGVPVMLALYALISSLRVVSKRAGLMILFFTYVCLVISFASLYFVIAWRSDLDDAESQFPYYLDLKKNWKTSDGTPALRATSNRAFKGIDAKLWTGVEEEARPKHYPKDRDAPIAAIFGYIDWLTEKGKDPDFAVRFSDFPTQVEVFADCVHYSLVTMSTVGYGDITPQSRLAKVVTDAQILLGQALFLFALGYVFGKSE